MRGKLGQWDAIAGDFESWAMHVRGKALVHRGNSMSFLVVVILPVELSEWHYTHTL